MKKFILLLCLIVVYDITSASDFKAGRDVVIDKPYYGDLYISGGNVTINAKVYGDVIIAGGRVMINDSIMNDVLIAGGTVFVNGYVGDDVRCAGGELTLNNQIEGDLIGAGGKIVMDDSASAASIILTGGEVTVNGRSRSSLKIAGGDVKFNGSVADDADLRGGNIYINGVIGGKVTLGASSEIIVSDKARIGRSIRYWLPFGRKLVVPPAVSIETPLYDPLLSITYSRWYFLGASSFLGLLWYLGMAYVLILLLQLLFTPVFERAGKRILDKPFHSGLWGLAFFIGVPIAAVLMIVTIIGVPVGLLMALFYVIVMLMATVISSVVITHWVENVSNRNWTFWHKSGIGLFTFILLKIITFTPFFWIPVDGHHCCNFHWKHHQQF